MNPNAPKKSSRQSRPPGARKEKKAEAVIVSKTEVRKSRIPSKGARSANVVKEKQIKLIPQPYSVGSAGSGSYMTQSRGSRSDSIRVRGRDYLARVNWQNSYDPGYTMLNMPLNPTALNGTRLQLLALTYEKYRFNRFKIIVRPNASANNSGGYGISYDHDPSDNTPPAGETGVRMFMAMKGTRDFSAWAPGEALFTPDEPITDFFTNQLSSSDERLIDQGQIYLWVLAGTTAAQIDLIVEIEYDLELFVPALDQLTSSVQYRGSSSSSSSVNLAGYNANKFLNALGQIAGLNGIWPGVVPETRGNTSRFPMRADASGAAFIDVPPGIYTLFTAMNTVLSAIGKDLPPLDNVWVPKNASETVTVEDVDTGLTILAEGAGQTATTQTEQVVAVPPSGARFYADMFDSSGLDNAAKKLFASFELRPGGGDIAPDVYAASRPGKFGAAARERLQLKKLARTSRLRDEPISKRRSLPSSSLSPQSQRF